MVVKCSWVLFFGVFSTLYASGEGKSEIVLQVLQSCGRAGPHILHPRLGPKNFVHAKRDLSFTFVFLLLSFIFISLTTIALRGCCLRQRGQ
jgi:hypothetical protein